MAKQHWWSRQPEPSPTPPPAPGPKPAPIVLGAQMAAATAAEEQHQAVDRGQSPLAETSYRTADHDLFHFQSSPADDVIGALADRFAAADPEERADLAARLTQDDLYDVISFGRRCSLAALRSADAGPAERGVRALAMVDIERVDWRDLLWAGQLLAYALGKLAAGRAEVFTGAAALAGGETAKALAGLARSEADDLSAFGYQEIETADGIGFIASQGEDYAPERDLVAVALAIVAGLDGDAWRLRPPEIGHTVYPVWFRRRPEDEVRSALDSITGCATIDGQLRVGDPATAGQQQLLVFVFEAGSAADAELIAAAAGASEEAWFVWASAVRDRVGAVVVSRSVVKDGVAFETAGSIERFIPVFEQALAEG